MTKQCTDSDNACHTATTTAITQREPLISGPAFHAPDEKREEDPSCQTNT